MTHYTLIMVAAGVGIPVLAALNAGLGLHLGSPIAAGIVAFSLALTCAVGLYLITGAQGLARLPSAPPQLMLAGFFIAFYLLSITMIGPKIGIGNAIFLVLMGQLLSAAIIDHFGLFGAKVTPLSATRALGLAFMGVGIFLTQILR